jgi:predicted nucleic acid-binding protein
MILYLDTSALLKLYLAEPGSQRMQQATNDAVATVTHLITYAEMRAALAQAVRMKRLSEADRAYQAQAFEADWPALQVIAVDEPLVRRAGELAERFGLRGYDSVHLAAAERAFDGAGRPATFMLAAFDDGLRIAAEALGLDVLH